MVRQADIFRESEGNAWFERNRDRLGERDPVSEAIETMGIIPSNVLEIGCANGWRLARLRDKYGCEVMGVEPSMDACLEAARLRVPAHQATATNLPVRSHAYDIVIFGFCLYLADPDEWFRIAAEANCVLRDFGHIIIHDFDAQGQFFARNYKHRDGVMSYHFDFAKLWLAHPWYSLVTRRLDEAGDSVTILKKSPICEVRP
jgi:ubiquinone/menaquinone biosynthesis C-methylase UbiE